MAASFTGAHLEAAIELPAKYAKHAKTEREVKVHEERWLHPAGEWWSQRRQGLDGAVFRMFSEGMSFVNGAPWNTQDAVAERTEAVSP